MKTELRTRRLQKGLTQAELAAAVSVSRQSIHAIEKGNYNPSVELALRLARFLDCRVEDLFGLEPEN